MKYEEWNEIYHKKKIINVIELLDKKEIETIKKLGIEILDKTYSEYEFDKLRMKIIKYYKDDTMDEQELSMVVPLEDTGVDREEYNKLVEKFEEIEKQIERTNINEPNKYEKILIALIETMLNQKEDIFPYSKITEILDLNLLETQNFNKEMYKLRYEKDKINKIKDIIFKYELY